MLKSSNPTLSRDIFVTERANSTGRSDLMTVSGTVNKSFVLIGLVFIGAFWSWDKVISLSQMMDYPGVYDQTRSLNSASPAMASTMIMVSGIAGFILAMVTIFVKKLSPYTSPIYAICEGVLLGAISAFFEMQYPGIAFQAILGTFGTFLAMLFMYKNKMIRSTPGFQRGMMAAMGGIFIVYLISFVMSFFGKSIPFIHGSGPIGIGFSVFVVGIAAFSLILDFDFIESGERAGAPKYMEWYGAFGLLVTLVWLYLEILKLLSKLRRRD